MLPTTGLLKNLLFLIDVAENNEVDIIGSDSDFEDKMDEKLLSKNLNRATGYLTPNIRQTFIQLRQTFTKTLFF